MKAARKSIQEHTSESSGIDQTNLTRNELKRRLNKSSKDIVDAQEKKARQTEQASNKTISSLSEAAQLASTRINRSANEPARKGEGSKIDEKRYLPREIPRGKKSRFDELAESRGV